MKHAGPQGSSDCETRRQTILGRKEFDWVALGLTARLIPFEGLTLRKA